MYVCICVCAEQVDHDFILWGPFDDKAAALETCGNMDPVAACSYSTSANEIIDVQAEASL